MRQTRSRFRASRGFTLIELLVVVAIICLLVAILIPALGRAKTLAKKTKSISNLNQQGKASLEYATDNRTRLPGGIGSMYFWAGKSGGLSSGYQNFTPDKRPLNKYLGVPLTGDDAYLRTLEVPIAQSPGDTNGFYTTSTVRLDSFYEAFGNSYGGNIKHNAAFRKSRALAAIINDPSMVIYQGEGAFFHVAWNGQSLNEFPELDWWDDGTFGLQFADGHAAFHRGPILDPDGAEKYGLSVKDPRLSDGWGYTIYAEPQPPR